MSLLSAMENGVTSCYGVSLIAASSYRLVEAAEWPSRQTARRRGRRGIMTLPYSSRGSCGYEVGVCRKQSVPMVVLAKYVEGWSRRGSEGSFPS